MPHCSQNRDFGQNQRKIAFNLTFSLVPRLLSTTTACSTHPYPKHPPPHRHTPRAFDLWRSPQPSKNKTWTLDNRLFSCRPRSSPTKPPFPLPPAPFCLVPPPRRVAPRPPTAQPRGPPVNPWTHQRRPLVKHPWAGSPSPLMWDLGGKVPSHAIFRVDLIATTRELCYRNGRRNLDMEYHAIITLTIHEQCPTRPTTTAASRSSAQTKWLAIVRTIGFVFRKKDWWTRPF